MRRPAFAAVLAMLAGALALLAPSAHAGSYSPDSYGARLLSLVNQAREQQGLHPLSATSGTGSVAASWTDRLASAQSLSHNPDLGHDLETHGSNNWTAYGENVGRGPAGNPDALFNAYMQSPEHRDNILTSAYRFVGVGVTFTGSSAWNTFDFVDAYASSTTSHPASTSSAAHQAAHHHVTQHVVQPAVSVPASALARPVVHQTAAPSSRAHVAHKRVSHRSVQVEGLRTASPRPRPMRASALGAVPTRAPYVSASTGGSPRSRAVAIALAVFALALVGRRWALITNAR